MDLLLHKKHCLNLKGFCQHSYISSLCYRSLVVLREGAAPAQGLFQWAGLCLLWAFAPPCNLGGGGRVNHCSLDRVTAKPRGRSLSGASQQRDFGDLPKAWMLWLITALYTMDQTPMNPQIHAGHGDWHYIPASTLSHFGNQSSLRLSTLQPVWRNSHCFTPFQCFTLGQITQSLIL